MASTAKKSKYSVLVVDDDEAVRTSLRMLLVASGYEVATAINGFDALLQLRHSTPDVITSDLNMPQMSGFEFLSVIRRRFPHIPVVAISGAFACADAVPNGVIADALYAKGQHEPAALLATIADLIQNSAARGVEHAADSAPVWIPRNGTDSKGIPFVVLTCTQCLRSFPLSVPQEAVHSTAIEETPCLFCLNAVRYIIDFSVSVASPLPPATAPIFDAPLQRAASE